MNVTSGDALCEFADCDALDPRKRANDYTGAALDQRACLGDNRVRSAVGRFDERFEGPLLVFLVLAQRKLVAPQGVPPQWLEGAFERGEHADLQAMGVGIRWSAGQERRGDQDDPCDAA